MDLDPAAQRRCAQTQDLSLEMLDRAAPGSIEYEVARNAVVKGFELALEVAGGLLRRAVREFAAEPGRIARLPFKQVLREAARVGLRTSDEVERWFRYRDLRNDAAHEYGQALARNVLAAVDDFRADLGRLLERLEAL